MAQKIHIIGASGSGTTTLGKALSQDLNYQHFDTDDFLWQPTRPPYQKKRSVEKREEILSKTLAKHDQWILTGSMVGGGQPIIGVFDLVIYLWIPQDIRISRLRKREKSKYGKAIDIGGNMYQTHLDFIEWASEYDSGDETMRSRKYHEVWLSNLSCKVIRLEGAYSLEENIQAVKRAIK
jgi:adenylate kinase family enzyme